MSDLSSLLNPTPNSEAPAPSKTSQLAPLQLDGQDHRSHHHQPGFGHAQSPIRPTLTSPGLDVLAAAASSTAPLISPTQQEPSIAQMVSRDQSSTIVDSSFAMRLGTQAASSSNQQEHPLHALSATHQLLSDQSRDTTMIDPTRSSSSGAPMDISANDSSLVPMHPQQQATTTQIKQASSSNLLSLSADSIPDRAKQVHVKAELTETLDAEMKDNSIPLQHIQQEPMPGTPLKNVISHTSPPPASQIEDPSVLPQKPRSGPTKKRAAPKKGNAVKPPSKKRKIDPESGKASPRTGTPATSRASGTPAPKRGKYESATPTRSSSVANPEDDDDDGELELFCVCRKPDDHTVMIGCDGPCEDWFHTRCVNMTNEKVALISKWYCPNCAAEGHETEWKRMCRLDGCSRPARTEGSNRSKYCSDEHGREFMDRFVSMNEKKPVWAATNKKRRRENYTDHDGNEGDENCEQDENRGGVLRPGELKALVDGAKDIVTFRKLGDGVLSPPETAATSPGHEAENKITYIQQETDMLDEIAKKRAEIETRRDMLSDREKLVHMVDHRRKNVLAKLKEQEKSLKDICGYDVCLTWSDEEFNGWRTSKEGREQLDNMVLRADPKLLDKQKEVEGEEAETGPGICKKRRCERHRTWYKLQQQDNAMEREDVRQKLRKLEEQEKGVKDRAMIRSLEEVQEAGD